MRKPTQPRRRRYARRALLSLSLLALLALLAPQGVSLIAQEALKRRGYTLTWAEVSWSGLALEWEGLSLSGARGQARVARLRLWPNPFDLPGALRLSGAALEVKREDQRWSLEIPSLALSSEGVGYEIDGGVALRASPDPRLEPFAGRLRGALRGDHLDLELSRPDGPLLRAKRGRVRAEIGALGLRLRGAEIQVSAYHVQAQRGGASAALTHVRRSPKGPWLIEGGQLSWAPSKEPPTASTPSASAPAPLKLPWLRFNDLSVEVNHPRLGLIQLEDLSGEAEGLDLKGRARMNQGEIGWSVTLDAARRRPQALGLELERVTLPEIKGEALKGQVSGALRLSQEGEEIALTSDLELELTLRHPALAQGPLKQAPLKLKLKGRGTRARFALEGEGQLGAAPFDLQLSVDPKEIKLEGGLGSAPCQAGVEAMKSWLGPYAGAAVKGDLKSRMRLWIPRDDLYALRFWVDEAPSCEVEALNAQTPPQITLKGATLKAPPRDVAWLKRPFIQPVARAPGIEVGPGTPGYTKLSRLPRYVPAAMWISEDLRFMTRVGPLDPWLLQRALKFNISRGRFVYGGSTLPQQLVKNLFLSHQKSLARKLQEALITTRMVQQLSREEILELYLNCIEFAPRVYGIRAAARHYFKKSPAALTPNEAVFLAMAKPNPRYMDIIRQRGHTPDTAHHRLYFERILSRMVARGFLSAAEAEAAKPYALSW